MAENIGSAGYKIIIWGVGNTTELNRKTIEEEGLLPSFFVDNNSAKWGETKWGIRIISLDELMQMHADAVVLISSANAFACAEIKRQLKQMGIATSYMFDEIIFGRHKEEILAVYDMLASNRSKETFAAIITARMAGTDIDEGYISQEQYFGPREFRIRNPKEVFIDCGAYVGDTLEAYLNVKEAVFDEIYAFEPEQRNFEVLSIRTERLQKEWGISPDRIHLVNGAVGSQCGSIYINNDRESMSAKVTNVDTGSEVPSYTLDSYLEGTCVGFIKADIEGFEMDMLMGAQESIKKYKPRLAICIYHQSADVYKIPLFLKGLNPAYKMDIRHHYYNYTETILYAY